MLTIVTIIQIGRRHFYEQKDRRYLRTVVYADGNLYWEHLRHGRQRLYKVAENTFVYGSQTLRFVKNGIGKITGCLYNTSQIRDLPFMKKK